MRSAVIVALGDPRSSDAGTWIDAVTWLRQELTEFVFRVSVVEGENVERDLARALAGISPHDEVLLHISGRLVDRGVVRTAGGRKIHIKTIGDALSARSGPSVSIFAELVYDGRDDALVGADHVTSMIDGFEARARGHAMIAAARPASSSIEGLALTRLFLGVARTVEPGGALLSSAIYRRIAGTPESLACVQSFAYVRGAADAHHQALVDRLRAETPIRARGVLDSAAWRLLRAPGSNDAIEALFAQIGRAAARTRLEELALRKRLVSLDSAARLDDRSTASVVRSFEWAARVLGVACPALYEVDEVPGEIAAVRAAEPSTAVGPTVMRGRSAKDLAYLAGRHLTYYRPEHAVLVYFPTTADLARLLMATIDVGSPRGRRTSRDPNVTALRDRLEREMTRAEHADIVAAVRDIDEGLDLTRWTRSIELTAGRAGLFLCGDVETATAIVLSESRGIAGVSPDERREDLIAFCSSPEHSELRRRFVVTTSESQPPPPFTADALHSP